MAMRDHWTPGDVRQIINNPAYAGIGPFPLVVDGDEVEIAPFPRIVDDNLWIKAQIQIIKEVGVRRTLINIRGSLHKSLGFRVASIAHRKWLSDSIKAIENEGEEPFFRHLLSQLRPKDKPIELVSTKIHVANITPDLMRVLSSDPSELYRLNPEAFEELICDRLYEMGFGVERVGKHTFQKDGGIDIVAWPKNTIFPFLMAVQAKHHRSPKQKTGPGPVRELLGVVQNFQFNAGVLVTNTTFTPDAKWFAEQKRMLVRLRDMSDIQRWLKNDFLLDYEWQEMPDEIEVCPGVVIHIPKSMLPTHL